MQVLRSEDTSAKEAWLQSSKRPGCVGTWSVSTLASPICVSEAPTAPLMENRLPNMTVRAKELYFVLLNCSEGKFGCHRGGKHKLFEWQNLTEIGFRNHTSASMRRSMKGLSKTHQYLWDSPTVLSTPSGAANSGGRRLLP